MSVGNLLKRLQKLEASKGNNIVRFKSFTGDLFSIPKKRVVDVYQSIFRGEVSNENEAVLNAVAVSPGEGNIPELLRMLQE